MRSRLAVPFMLLCLAGPAVAQVGVGIEVPGVSIGINLPLYPQLARVPGYPVYYAPRMNANYFFYDGMYWVYQDDNWYGSTWYNGPWNQVAPDFVPAYLLRVPVRYYRQPPGYFQGWQRNAPPRWGDHWGHDWTQRRNGWDRWDHHSAPAPAPLPAYQKQFSGAHYPRAEQQQAIQARNYHYQHHDPAVRQLHPAVAQRAQPQAAPQQARPPAPQHEQARQAPPREHPQAQQHEQAKPQQAPQHEQPKPQASVQQVRPPVPRREQPQVPQQQARPPQQAPQHERPQHEKPLAPKPDQPQAPQQQAKSQPPQARHEQGRPPEGKPQEPQGGQEGGRGGNEDRGREHGK